MSAMVNLEVPWINIMSKMDLVTPNPDGPATSPRIGRRNRRNIARYLDPDPLLLVPEPGHEPIQNSKFHALNQALVQLVRPLSISQSPSYMSSDRRPSSRIIFAS